jgi:hypothetical protein
VTASPSATSSGLGSSTGSGLGSSTTTHHHDARPPAPRPAPARRRRTSPAPDRSEHLIGSADRSRTRPSLNRREEQHGLRCALPRGQRTRRPVLRLVARPDEPAADHAGRRGGRPQGRQHAGHALEGARPARQDRGVGRQDRRGRARTPGSPGPPRARAAWTSRTPAPSASTTTAARPASRSACSTTRRPGSSARRSRSSSPTRRPRSSGRWTPSRSASSRPCPARARRSSRA